MTVREHMALQLAGQRFKYPGARDSAICEQVGMSPTRHAQVVGALLDRADAERERPALVRQLRAVQGARRRARTRRVT